MNQCMCFNCVSKSYCENHIIQFPDAYVYARMTYDKIINRQKVSLQSTPTHHCCEDALQLSSSLTFLFPFFFFNLFLKWSAERESN